MACTNHTDLLAWTQPPGAAGYDGFAAAEGNCGRTCAPTGPTGFHTCMTPCLAGALHMSFNCSACMSFWADCVEARAQAVNDQFSHFASCYTLLDDEHCLDLAVVQCNDAFTACSGLAVKLPASLSASELAKFFGSISGSLVGALVVFYLLRRYRHRLCPGHPPVHTALEEEEMRRRRGRQGGGRPSERVPAGLALAAEPSIILDGRTVPRVFNFPAGPSEDELGFLGGGITEPAAGHVPDVPPPPPSPPPPGVLAITPSPSFEVVEPGGGPHERAAATEVA
jgi:hypothetical protein